MGGPSIQQKCPYKTHKKTHREKEPVESEAGTGVTLATGTDARSHHQLGEARVRFPPRASSKNQPCPPLDLGLLAS